MSLQTWKEKYYPEDAAKFNTLPLSKENIAAALKHSIRKWIGLRPANRKRHGLGKRRSISRI